MFDDWPAKCRAMAEQSPNLPFGIYCAEETEGAGIIGWTMSRVVR
jgi:hypothetical protein